MAKVNDLGRDPIPALVLRIAIPSMLAQFVSVFYSIVDRIFVSSIPEVGDLALAGLGVCGPVVTMVGSFAFLIGIGGTPLMGISLGERNPARARQIVANCFAMLLALSAILTAAVFALKEPMLRLFGASDITYEYADAYFSVYIAGTVFALLSTGMNQFIIAQGYAKTGMLSIMIGTVMNIILDPVFIFVFDMGVSGAALATIISQAASAAFVICFLFSRRSNVKISFGGYDLGICLRVLKLGFTPFAIIAVDNVMIIAMNALLQKYGGPAQGDILVTVNTIVQSFMLVVTMPLGGISGGTQCILSYNYGACNSERVIKGHRFITAICAGYTTVLFILARTCGPLFISLFTEDAAIAAEAFRAIKIVTLAIIPLGVQYAIIDGLTGMGQVQLSLPLSFWRKLVYFVSIFLLADLAGAPSVFFAEPISDILGPLVSIPVCMKALPRIMKDREQDLRPRKYS
ncbi:MAG: MATE family efflux transporter [Oscillospiraceae bacterium]|nr:MATE family efflux transporter [Oscillospiraceae bacterium]